MQARLLRMRGQRVRTPWGPQATLSPSGTPALQQQESGRAITVGGQAAGL